MDIFVNTIGLILIILTLWWFFFNKLEAQVTAADGIRILVKDGIYEPSRIKVPAQTSITLHFIRQDPTPCAETVVFPQLKRSYLLPLNEQVDIKLEPQPKGELEFTCQMGMYRGRLVVE